MTTTPHDQARGDTAAPVPRRLLPAGLDARLRRIGDVLRRLDHRRWQVARALFVRRVLVHAALVGAHVDLEVAYDARIHPTTRVRITPGTTTRVHLGPGTLLLREVTLLLRGGHLELQQDNELRDRCLLNVGGHLVLRRQATLSYATHVHCDNEVVLDELAGASERVVITDSSHHHTSPDEWFYHSVRSGTTHVGRNTWLASHAVVTRNVRIGDRCIVAANSVVLGDVPDDHLASGTPAQVRPLRQPWLEPPADGDGS